MATTIMPQPVAFANEAGDDCEPIGSPDQVAKPLESPRFGKNSVLGRFQSFNRFGRWLKKDESHGSNADKSGHKSEATHEDLNERTTHSPKRSLLDRKSSKRVIPELPRPQTFHRQKSEQRDRLFPVEPSSFERRAQSEGRRCVVSKTHLRSPASMPLPSSVSPNIDSPSIQHAQLPPLTEVTSGDQGSLAAADRALTLSLAEGTVPAFSSRTPSETDASDDIDQFQLQQELQSKWILNLSMHFRDKSDREKFFVTYAEEPNRWRRVTVSCDYRNAQPGSLEADLKELHYQRDKSKRIYEAIRESLPDIQFYPTVTNLKLETDDGRLHVHVTEDVNEKIEYPSEALMAHIDCPRYRESDLVFDTHLSGFVYKISVHDRVLIKKEIPSPDTIEEFLYEINALTALRRSDHVIQFHGLVTDDRGEFIKGLLISFAAKGALVDFLYDFKSSDHLPWPRLERWAMQIVQGLSDIHEAGFVQGDFTLSNIVIDEHDDCKIIDINRRGCPIGWEPPELLALIERGQRISMHIGVKSDIFQLGMVLAGLAKQIDEPDRIDRYLLHEFDDSVPEWYCEAVRLCLSSYPQIRPSAKDLLALFPSTCRYSSSDMPLVDNRIHVAAPHRADKEYIDPATAVSHADLEEHWRRKPGLIERPPSEEHDGSSSDYIHQRRGRRSSRPSDHRSSPRQRPNSSATSLSNSCSNEQQLEHYKDPDVEYIDGQWTQKRDNGHAELRQACSQESFGAISPFIESEANISHANPADLGMRHFRVAAGDLTAYDEAALEDNFSPPLHQDSGFDEHMLENMLRTDPTDQRQAQKVLDPDLDPLSLYTGPLSLIPRLHEGEANVPSNRSSTTHTPQVAIEDEHSGPLKGICIGTANALQPNNTTALDDQMTNVDDASQMRETTNDNYEQNRVTTGHDK